MNYIHYYNLYKDKIYSYFFHNLYQDQEIADDLSSETFLKAYKHFNGYNDEFEFSTWIYTIARNVLFDYYKRQKKIAGNIAIDETTDILYGDFTSYDEEYINKIYNKDLTEDIIKSINNLEQKQKEVLVLKLVKEYSNKEIAEETGYTESNVRQIASRGIKKIRSIFFNKE